MTQKLFKKFEGPYLITKVTGPLDYEIREVARPRKMRLVVNVVRLKKWHSSSISGLDTSDNGADDEWTDSEDGNRGQSSEHVLLTSGPSA